MGIWRTALVAGWLFLPFLPAAAQQPDTLRLALDNPGNAPQPGAQQGESVAVDGGFAVVGAPFDDFSVSDSGVVKIYSSATGALLQTLINPSPAASDRFGTSVAVSGMRVMIGAHYDDSSAADAGVAYLYELASTNPTVPAATFHNPNPAVGDLFGSSVAISGMRVVVGAVGGDTGAANAGHAYVYDVVGPTPTMPIAALTNPSPSANENFGWAVAISETFVVVGVPFDNSKATGAGIVYVYDLASATPPVPVATINNPSPSLNAWFGISVAISGTRLIVGASRDNTGASSAGSAYVFDLSGVTPLVPTITLRNPSPATGDWFGRSVAISGTRLVVGAPKDNTGALEAGSAYYYDLAGGTPTVPLLTFLNPTPETEDRFGWSVAISGTRAIVGAYLDDTVAFDAGSAYAYELISPTPTVPEHTLNHPSPARGHLFGHAVALSGTWLVVGTPYFDVSVTSDESAYVYDLGSGRPGLPAATLKHPGPAANNEFGRSVAASGARVVVGAPNDDAGAVDAGSAHVYDLSSATPHVPVTSLPNPSPALGDQFGSSVAVSGAWVVAGVPFDDVGATDAGSAHVYDLARATLAVPVATLINPSPSQNDWFGFSVAVSGARVVIGAYGDGAGAFSAGSAYVYDLASAMPTLPVATLNNPSPAVSDQFGQSVAVSGTRVVVAAFWDDTGAADAGSVYVYDLTSAVPSIPVATFSNPNPVADDWFGSSVSVSGTRVVVGTRYDDTGAENAGIAYVYDLTHATPTVPVAVLYNPSPIAWDNFANSVAIDGATVAVGASGKDGVTLDQGAAYIFGAAKPEALRFQPLSALGEGRYRMPFSAFPGGPLIPADTAHLEVQGTTNLINANWVTMTNPIVIDNGIGQVEFTATNNPPHQFYRIKVQ